MPLRLRALPHAGPVGEHDERARLGAGSFSHLASASRSLTGGSAPSTRAFPRTAAAASKPDQRCTYAPRKGGRSTAGAARGLSWASKRTNSAASALQQAHKLCGLSTPAAPNFSPESHKAATGFAHKLGRGKWRLAGGCGARSGCAPPGARGMLWGATARRARAGVLGPHCVPLERATARACHEAGARVAENTPFASMRRRWTTNALPIWGGVQVAVDTTLVSPVQANSAPRPGDREPGLALRHLRSRRCRLLILGLEVGGRWLPEGVAFAVQAYVRRWAALPAVAAQRAFAPSPLQLPVTCWRASGCPGCVPPACPVGPCM